MLQSLDCSTLQDGALRRDHQSAALLAGESGVIYSIFKSATTLRLFILFDAYRIIYVLTIYYNTNSTPYVWQQYCTSLGRCRPTAHTNGQYTLFTVMFMYLRAIELLWWDSLHCTHSTCVHFKGEYSTLSYHALFS